MKSSFWTRWRGRLKFLMAISGLAVAVASYGIWGSSLSFEQLVEREAELRAIQQKAPWIVYGGSFLLYVVVTALSLPVAAALTLSLGWYLGFWPALLLVSFASTLGATLAFLFSRYLFRDWVERRWGARLASIQEAWKREGAYYLFSLRLVPGVPFFVVNLVMGLTPIRVRTFWWVSQLGMLPGTMIYVFAGSRVPNLQTLHARGLQAVFSPSQLSQILIAFTLLGIFPVLVRWLLRRISVKAERSSPADELPPSSTAG